jgi:transcriptional regulator with XRE-family HTH domain
MNDEQRLDQMKLDKNLKKMMLTKKLSLKTLSGQVGVPPSTIHGWLNGAAPKSLVDLKKISDFFGISIDELCFGAAEKNLTVIRESVIGDLGTVELVLRIKER